MALKKLLWIFALIFSALLVSGFSLAALPYWIEDTNGDGVADYVWIKVNLTEGDNVLYYNLEPVYSPDGNKVFEFFDDFEGNDLDNTKWTFSTTGSGTYSVSGGILTINSNPSSRTVVYTKNTFSLKDKIIRVRAKIYGSGSAYEAAAIFVSNLKWDTSTPSNLQNYYIIWSEGTTDGYNRLGGKCEGNLEADETIPQVNDFAIFETTLKENGGCFQINFTKNEIYSASINAINISLDGFLYIHLGEGSDYYGGTGYYDYIFVRKYTPNEPTVSVSGNKITITSTTNLTDYQVKIPAGDLGVQSLNDSIGFYLEPVYFKLYGKEFYEGETIQLSYIPSNTSISNVSGTITIEDTFGNHTFNVTFNGTHILMNETYQLDLLNVTEVNDKNYNETKKVYLNISFDWNGSSYNVSQVNNINVKLGVLYEPITRYFIKVEGSQSVFPFEYKEEKFSPITINNKKAYLFNDVVSDSTGFTCYKTPSQNYAYAYCDFKARDGKLHFISFNLYVSHRYQVNINSRQKETYNTTHYYTFPDRTIGGSCSPEYCSLNYNNYWLGNSYYGGGQTGGSVSGSATYSSTTHKYLKGETPIEINVTSNSFYLNLSNEIYNSFAPFSLKLEANITAKNYVLLRNYTLVDYKFTLPDNLNIIKNFVYLSGSASNVNAQPTYTVDLFQALSPYYPQLTSPSFPSFSIRFTNEVSPFSNVVYDYAFNITSLVNNDTISYSIDLNQLRTAEGVSTTEGQLNKILTENGFLPYKVTGWSYIKYYATDGVNKSYTRFYWFAPGCLEVNGPVTVNLYYFGDETNLEPTNAIRLNIWVRDGATQEPVSDAIVKVLKEMSPGQYVQVEQLKTDSEGKTTALVQAYDYNYKFIVEKNCSVLYTTSPTTISTSDVIIYVSQGGGDTSLTEYYKDYLSSIAYNMSYDPNTEVLKASYSDTSGISREHCFEVQYVNVDGEYETKQKDCFNSASATKEYNLSNEVHEKWRIKYYVDGILIETLSFDKGVYDRLKENYNPFAVVGFIMIISILTIVFGLMELFFFALPLVLYISYYTGFLSIQTPLLLTITLLSWMFAIISLFRKEFFGS